MDLELPSEDRQTVGKDIQKVEFGWPILSHGFIKKTQKTPQQDIDLALKRKREAT
jgi:phage-related protein